MSIVTPTVKRTADPTRLPPWAPRRFSALVALLLIPLILSACGVRFADNPGDGGSTSTIGTGACPGAGTSIRGAYTPRELRTAYGVESLCQQGYTGKGQTV